MKTLNTTTRRFFAVMFMGLALALTACGSGDNGNSVNATDGVVTQAEADSITKGMTTDQVAAILGNPIQNLYPSLVYPGETVNGRPTKWGVNYNQSTGLAASVIHFYSDGSGEQLQVRLL